MMYHASRLLLLTAPVFGSGGFEKLRLRLQDDQKVDEPGMDGARLARSGGRPSGSAPEGRYVQFQAVQMRFKKRGMTRRFSDEPAHLCPFPQKKTIDFELFPDGVYDDKEPLIKLDIHDEYRDKETSVLIYLKQLALVRPQEINGSGDLCHLLWTQKKVLIDQSYPGPRPCGFRSDIANWTNGQGLSPQTTILDVELCKSEQDFFARHCIIPKTKKLPDGWEVKYDEKNQPYYVDHNTRKNQWEPPLLSEEDKSTLCYTIASHCHGEFAKSFRSRDMEIEIKLDISRERGIIKWETNPAQQWFLVNDEYQMHRYSPSQCARKFEVWPRLTMDTLRKDVGISRGMVYETRQDGVWTRSFMRTDFSGIHRRDIRAIVYEVGDMLYNEPLRPKDDDLTRMKEMVRIPRPFKKPEKEIKIVEERNYKTGRVGYVHNVVWRFEEKHNNMFFILSAVGLEKGLSVTVSDKRFCMSRMKDAKIGENEKTLTHTQTGDEIKFKYSLFLTDDNGDKYELLFLIDEDRAIETMSRVVKHWAKAYDENFDGWRIKGTEGTLPTANVIRIMVEEVLTGTYPYGGVSVIKQIEEGPRVFPKALENLAKSLADMHKEHGDGTTNLEL